MQDMGIEGLNWNHGDLRNERWGELGQFLELMSWGQFWSGCHLVSPCNPQDFVYRSPLVFPGVINNLLFPSFIT